jgi:hypothetical protein
MTDEIKHQDARVVRNVVRHRRERSDRGAWSGFRPLALDRSRTRLLTLCEIVDTNKSPYRADSRMNASGRQVEYRHDFGVR